MQLKSLTQLPGSLDLDESHTPPRERTDDDQKLKEKLNRREGSRSIFLRLAAARHIPSLFVEQ